MDNPVITNKVIVTPKGKRVLSQFVSGYDYVEGGRIHLHNGLSFSAWPPQKKDEFLAFMDTQMSSPWTGVVDLRAYYKQCFGDPNEDSEVGTAVGTAAGTAEVTE